MLNAFTKNFTDNSTDTGFQFTFHCDLCGDGYKTEFVPSKIQKKAGFLSGLGKAASLGSSLLGSSVGSTIDSGIDTIANRIGSMSPQWHQEHDFVFETSQEEAKNHFHRCPKCKNYVCNNDWNEQEGLCVDDAPRENVEVASARAKKMTNDIHQQADKTQVFTGKIESRQTICPVCRKPSGSGKFCNNCGVSLALLKCPKCGTQLQAGIKFCGECGADIDSSVFNRT